jgi:hypothetical protein
MSRFGYFSSRYFSHHGMAMAAGFVILAICAATPARSQEVKELKVTPSANDRTAAGLATHLNHQARPSRTQRGSAALRSELSTAHSASKLGGTDGSFDRDLLIRYPADVVYNGGAVVEAAESHAIYMLPNGSCPVSQCWGDPEGFLRDLGNSEFIHVLDQYAGLEVNNRYTVGQHASIGYKPPAVPLTDNDVLGFVHAVASVTGKTGYGHIYHVFLPPGQDECFDATFTVCYSPDIQASFAFCAYHGSADFSDIGHILYSVEPFQDVPGCQDPPGTPNGQLVDSTNDSLSHELFETISDPDLDAWWNSTPAVTGLFGEEIGDECVFITPPAYGDPSVFRIGRKLYAVQLEYSNSRHGCTNEP